MQQTNPECLSDIEVSINFDPFCISLYVVLITGFCLRSVWVRNDLITRQNALAERWYYNNEEVTMI